MCGQQKGTNRANIISLFDPKRQGVTKKGQGVAPCKNGLGRTLDAYAYNMDLLDGVALP